MMVEVVMMSGRQSNGKIHNCGSSGGRGGCGAVMLGVVVVVLMTVVGALE